MNSRQIGGSPAGPTGNRFDLKLCHRPGTVAILDDHPAFVEMLTGALERSWKVQPFESAQHCWSFLAQESTRRRADLHAQQCLVDAWRRGAALIPSILDYWSCTHTSRRALAKVLVVDDHMPGMDGLDLLAGHADWPGQRLLLCTKAFEQEVVARALEDGVIDMVLAKQDRDFPSQVRTAVRELYEREDAQCRQVWAMTLTAEQQELLHRPDIASALASRLVDAFDEWLVLGHPFGVIGLDRAGGASWLPLCMRRSLPKLSDAALTQGMTPQDAQLISRGSKLANPALHGELGEGEVQIVDAAELGQQGDMLVAVTGIALPRDAEHAHAKALR